MVLLSHFRVVVTTYSFIDIMILIVSVPIRSSVRLLCGSCEQAVFGNKHKTFRPKKNFQKGTKLYQLHKYAKVAARVYGFIRVRDCLPEHTLMYIHHIHEILNIFLVTGNSKGNSRSGKPTQTQARAHARTHACTHAHMHACMHARTHACTNARTNTRTHSPTHKHTHT